MASRNAQTHAKRARELAVRERRELKRAKKAAQRAAHTDESVDPQVESTVIDPAAASEDVSERADNND